MTGLIQSTYPGYPGFTISISYKINLFTSYEIKDVYSYFESRSKNRDLLIQDEYSGKSRIKLIFFLIGYFVLALILIIYFNGGI